MSITILIYILAWIACIFTIAFIILFKGSFSRLLEFKEILVLGTKIGEGAVHLQPFSTIGNYLMSWSNWFHRLNIIANTVAFFPIGILIGFVLKGKSGVIVALLIGGMYSLGLEMIQYTYAIGSFDVDDIILNTLGAIIGYLLTRVCMLYKIKIKGFVGLR